MTDSFDKVWDNQGSQIPALRLHENLGLIKTHIDAYRRRWFWELLQNASDYNSSVDIRLEVSDNIITFSHNGEPFSTMDMFNLVRPFSKKSSDQQHTDNIGRFGTGLVSTHVLSSCIEVRGIVKLEDATLNSFNVKLDRSCFADTDALTQQIADSKEQLRTSCTHTSYTRGDFSTTFIYDLSKPLPGIPIIQISDDDFRYLYDVLPYTMCFLRKVKSVSIEDKRTGHNTSFSIKQIADCGEKLTFSTEHDANTTTQSYYLFTQNDVQTVLTCDNSEVKPYPKQIAKFFCGLPMIGTENIGLPIIINSIKFEPTTERDAIELVPGQNEINRTLLRDAALLYKKVLDFVAQNRLKNAFHIAKIRNKYNCSDMTGSNQQFYKLFIEPCTSFLLQSAIVRNPLGDFIPLQEAYFPYEDNKADYALYQLCEEIIRHSLPNHSLPNEVTRHSLPHKEDYPHWVDTIDFSITHRQYTKKMLYCYINSLANINDFTTTSGDNRQWLFQLIEYAKAKDLYTTSQYKLLPSQNGTLLFSHSLWHDDGIPALFKELYDNLRADKIETILLDPKFDSLGVVSNIKSAKDVAKDIDDILCEKYKQNNSNPQNIIDPIRRLYNWIKEQQKQKTLSAETLRSYFPWFYPKQAALIVDCLSDNERDQALIIAQSGGLEALASLANNLTSDQLKFMQQNMSKLQQLLEKENSEKVQVLTDNGTSVDIKLTDTPYAGLSKNEMQHYLEEAKKQVKRTMEMQGFDFSSATGLDASSYGNIYGVKDPTGVECPLVVHSYRNTSREFALTAMDWKQLAQRNSMLWIVTTNGAKCVPFYQLMANRGRISLSFNVDNCDSKKRMTALAEIMRDFRGLHFDFGSLQDTFRNIAERFNQPERELTEILEADDVKILM